LQKNYFYYRLVLIAQRKILVLAIPVMSSKLHNQTRPSRSSAFYRVPFLWSTTQVKLRQMC